MKKLSHVRNWMVVLSLILLVILTASVAIFVTTRRMEKSFDEFIEIYANVYGNYSLVGYSEERTAEIHRLIASQAEDDSVGERFRSKWGMSKDAYEQFCANYGEYRAFEIRIELANESDAYLSIAIGCETPDVFVERNSFLFCDGPKLPEHTRFVSDTEAYVLVKMPEGAKDKELNETDELRLYCYAKPDGFDNYPPIKVRLFPK